MKFTVFFANNTSKQFACLEDVLCALTNIDFVQVTLCDYVFSKKIYLCQDITNRIRRMLKKPTEV